MKKYQDPPIVVKHFIGRQHELEQLKRALFRLGSFRPLIVSGPAGVGKTTLVSKLVSSRRDYQKTIWIDMAAAKNAAIAIDSLVRDLEEERLLDETHVVLDGSDSLDDEQIESATSRIYNWKRIKSIIFTMRRSPELKRGEVFKLEPLILEEARLVFVDLLTSLNFSSNEIERAFGATSGNPIAILLLADLLRSGGLNEFNRIVDGQIYAVSDVVSPTGLISIVQPNIILANEAILSQLKKEPKTIFDLTPRKFEEVLAELLRGMGWEIELTKSTRDGGKDILAYLNTELGKILCLVEAKHYREDRKIGVDLVRNLYGTLCDYQANSGMLVTTSSFTPDAQSFQARHQFQLSLRDYSDLVKWIRGYNSNGK